MTYKMMIHATKGVKALILLWLLSLPAFHLFAQDSLLLRDYQYVRQHDIWLTSPNAAALTRYERQNIADASVALRYQSGGLYNYYEARRALQAQAAIEAFHRLGPRAVVFGSMSYDNYSGRSMAGSAFIDPQRKPFDIVEDSLTNAGTKHRDTYTLTGAFGYELWQGYAVGARVDYTAANYAKYKDLRHKNKLMDLRATASLYAPLTSWLNMGLAYTYHRQTESLTFSTYGNSDKVYKSLIDYGVFSGRVEQFGEEGFTDKGREMPLFEDGHGGSVQIEARPARQWSLYASVALSQGEGYYGRKSPYTITYTNHTRRIVATEAAATLTLPNQQHRLALTYQMEKVRNYRNVYRELKNNNGATYYEYYGDVRTGSKQWMDLGIGYTANLGIRHELPTWVLHAGADFTERRLLSWQHPYKRKQKLNTTTLSLQATRNTLLKRGLLSLSARLAWHDGSGEPYRDLVDAVPSDKQAAPPTMDAWLYREHQYLTARQWECGGSAKYAFIFPGTRLQTYVSLSVSHRHAAETSEGLSRQGRTESALAIGCTF